MSEASVRRYLQKCVYWSNLALEKGKEQYALTVQWRRAREYAKRAQEVAARVASKDVKWTQIKWSEVEARILAHGYPVLSNQTLWIERDAPEEEETEQPFTDPLEQMKHELQESHAEFQVLHESLQDLEKQQQAREHTIQSLRTELETRLTPLVEENQRLKKQLLELQDDYYLLTRREKRLRDKMQSISTTQTLEQECCRAENTTLVSERQELVETIEAYRLFMQEIVQSLDEEQRATMQRLLVD